MRRIRVDGFAGRQRYFLIGGLLDLIGGLLDRPVYLSVGPSIILGFIGVKLILHALHQNTTVASLIRTRGRVAGRS